MQNLKSRIAASATLVGLGGLAGVALSSGAPGGDAANSQAVKPDVRTKVIRRTTRMTRHVKPRYPTGSGGIRLGLHGRGGRRIRERNHRILIHRLAVVRHPGPTRRR